MEPLPCLNRGYSLVLQEESKVVFESVILMNPTLLLILLIQRSSLVKENLHFLLAIRAGSALFVDDIATLLILVIRSMDSHQILVKILLSIMQNHCLIMCMWLKMLKSHQKFNHLQDQCLLKSSLTVY